ncbi:hypothetical protein GCK32_009403, partial [Trichostrongylus colubriformis]
VRDSLPDSTTADSPRVIRGSGFLSGSASLGALMSTDFRVVQK